MRCPPVDNIAEGTASGTHPATSSGAPIYETVHDSGFQTSDAEVKQKVDFKSGANAEESSGGQRRRSVMHNMTEYLCQSICTGMVMVPRSMVDLQMGHSAEVPSTRKTKTLTLVMSYDNVAALLVISSLSVFGAIYLWKICTRRHCSCRLCRNQYRMHHLLGSGGYGSVHVVQRIADGERFVAKKIEVRDITEVDEYSLEAKELITLRHRHIVSYEDDFVHVEYGALEPKTYFIIVMEYCPEGDLKEKIELDFCNFTEDWVRNIFSQLLQAVQYLHSKNVIHRDLKSQNVFLAHDGRIRLGDFGLCKHTRTRALGSATLTHAGTDCYMAPEMLSSSRYGKPADMWSLGCVLYELCSGQFMWELDGILGAVVMKDSHAVSKLVQNNVVSCVGTVLISVMKRLLSINPASRPTATTCMRKKLFKRGFQLSHEPFGVSLGDAGETEVGQGSECSHKGDAAFSIDGEEEEDEEEEVEEEEEEDEEEEEEVTSSHTPKRRRRRKRTGRR